MNSSEETLVLFFLCTLLPPVIVVESTSSPGRPVIKAEFPFQVSVRKRASSGLFAHMCSGALIDDSHVLTAAICVDGSTAADLQVVAGTTTMFQRGTDGRVQQSVQMMTLHPLFDHDVLTNNVAILTVDKPFLNTKDVKPASWKNSTHGGKCTISGWTMIFKKAPPNFQTLRVLRGRIVSQKDCFKNLEVSGFSFNNATTCISFSDIENDEVCSVDNGSLLVCDGTLTGVASSGQACSHSSVPYIFSNISAHAEWISNITNG